MAYIINLKSFKDNRGSLVSLQNSQLPFDIKRSYSIINPRGVRGGHRHKKTIQAMVCILGSCKVYNNNGEKEQEFILDSAEKCLILEPQDWHEMQHFSQNCVLQILASHEYDINDYIDEKY